MRIAPARRRADSNTASSPAIAPVWLKAALEPSFWRPALSTTTGFTLAAASVKPVVVLKAGRQKDGSKAAFSHTGAMAGDDAVFESALRRAGAIRISRYA